VDDIPAKRETPHTPIISDPQPVESVGAWAPLGHAATVGIFLLLFGAFLYLGRAILLPIVLAATVALTLAPVVKFGKRHGVSPWITALLIVLFALGLLGSAITAMAGPVSEWIARAPEIWSSIKGKFAVLDQPRPLRAHRRVLLDAVAVRHHDRHRHAVALPGIGQRLPVIAPRRRNDSAHLGPLACQPLSID